MGDFVHEEGTGTIFKNNYKEEGSKQPDYKGTMKIGGEDIKIVGWKRTTKNGDDYFYLAVDNFVPKDKSPF